MYLVIFILMSLIFQHIILSESLTHCEYFGLIIIMHQSIFSRLICKCSDVYVIILLSWYTYPTLYLYTRVHTTTYIVTIIQKSRIISADNNASQWIINTKTIQCLLTSTWPPSHWMQFKQIWPLLKLTNSE